MDRTRIEWTDSTWSPLRVLVRPDAARIARNKGYSSLVQIAEKMAGHTGPHCEHVSPSCEHCYAATNNHRCLPSNGTGLPYDRRSRDLVEPFVDEKILLQPLKWKPMYTTNGRLGTGRWEYARPRRIFVENQSDLFGDWWTDEMIDQVFAIMALCPQHTFQVLTKRPERMRRYLQQVECEKDIQRWINAAYEALPHLSPCAAGMMEDLDWPLPNVWLGVSVENQKAADERIPLLLQTPAAVRFISAEPLLGPVRLDWPNCYLSLNRKVMFGEPPRLYPGLDWIIAGGESGPGARPMHPDWARSLHDQCQAAGVAFFFKQQGEFEPFCYSGGAEDGEEMGERPGTYIAVGDRDPKLKGRLVMKRVGKKAAGALLDGREWREFPEVRNG